MEIEKKDALKIKKTSKSNTTYPILFVEISLIGPFFSLFFDFLFLLLFAVKTTITKMMKTIAELLAPPIIPDKKILYVHDLKIIIILKMY